MKLPSNKVAVVFILLVLIVSGIIANSSIQKKNLVDNKEDGGQDSNVFLTIKRENKNPTLDSDNDGLFDWEELLLGTDPKNPDTDGDGTSDGDEIKLGRDPVVPGPDDDMESIREKKYQEQRNFYNDYVKGTLTDRVGQNFIQTYFENNQNTAFTSDVKEEFATNLANEAKEAVKISEKYSYLNAITFISEDKEKIRKYGNEFATIHIGMLQTLATLENTDSNSYLNQITDTYLKTANNLMAIEIPDPVAKVHVQIANNLVIVAEALSVLNNESSTDPLKSLFVIESYNKAATSQPELYTTIKNFFDQNDIIFDNSEYGNFWNQI